jgi:hypothetical protein
MLVCGIPREFRAAITFICGLTGGCTHTGFHNTSLQAITMEAQITLATPNELLFSVKRLFANFTQVFTGHAQPAAGLYRRDTLDTLRCTGHSSEAGAQAQHISTPRALEQQQQQQ